MREPASAHSSQFPASARLQHADGRPGLFKQECLLLAAESWGHVRRGAKTMVPAIGNCQEIRTHFSESLRSSRFPLRFSSRPYPGTHDAKSLGHTCFAKFGCFNNSLWRSLVRVVFRSGGDIDLCRSLLGYFLAYLRRARHVLDARAPLHSFWRDRRWPLERVSDFVHDIREGSRAAKFHRENVGILRPTGRIRFIMGRVRHANLGALR